MTATAAAKKIARFLLLLLLNECVQRAATRRCQKAKRKRSPLTHTCAFTLESQKSSRRKIARKWATNFLSTGPDFLGSTPNGPHCLEISFSYFFFCFDSFFRSTCLRCSLLLLLLLILHRTDYYWPPHHGSTAHTIIDDESMILLFFVVRSSFCDDCPRKTRFSHSLAHPTTNFRFSAVHIFPSFSSNHDFRKNPNRSPNETSTFFLHWVSGIRPRQTMW